MIYFIMMLICTFTECYYIGFTFYILCFMSCQWIKRFTPQCSLSQIQHKDCSITSGSSHLVSATIPTNFKDATCALKQNKNVFSQLITLDSDSPCSCESTDHSECSRYAHTCQNCHLPKICRQEKMQHCRLVPCVWKVIVLMWDNDDNNDDDDDEW